MTTANKLLVATLVCNLFILVGVGHGVGPMGVLELELLGDVLSGETVLKLVGGYSVRLSACALLSIICQLALLAACFLDRWLKTYLACTGLFILYVALLFLTFDLSSG